MNVLGIESSCDETAIALVSDDGGLLAHCLHSQVALHARYGGVVPELASRDHVRRIDALYQRCLAEAGLQGEDIDAIAYTAGPGLAGALMVGAGYAAGLATGLGCPLVPVHHMEGHLLAPLLEPDPPSFPFLALLVSGGHSLLVDVSALGDYRVLGQSIDDAVGEAFDKAAKALGLPYPGGPALAELAESGDEQRFRLPRPMTDRPGLDFSFSGLKTALVTAIPDPADARDRADLAAAFQAAAVDTLRIKCERALDASGRDRLVVAGGVGANRRLRAELQRACAARGCALHFPRQAFCTDNAAMIALTGLHRAPDARREPAGPAVRARWPLDELRPPGSAAG